MEIKTSTVKSVQANGTFKEMNKWEVEMENGDCGENLTKGDQEYFVKGREVEYEWHPGKYPKIKRPYKKDGQPTQTPQRNDNVQLYIIRQSSLKIALDYHNITMDNPKNLTRDDVAETSEFFTQYVMNGLDKVTRIEAELPEEIRHTGNDIDSLPF